MLTAGPLSTANLELLRQEIQQIDELVGKCEADISQHHGVFMLRLASMSRP